MHRSRLLGHLSAFVLTPTLLATGLILVPAPASARTHYVNRVTNGEFERGTTGWAAGTARTHLRVVRAGSSRVAELSTVHASTVALTDRPRAVRASIRGQRFVASAWVRAIRPGRNGQTGRIAIRQARRHGREVVGSSPFRVGRSWKRVSVAVYAAGPGSRIEVRLLAGLRHGQRLQVDHVKVLGSVGRVAPAPRPRSSAPMALPAKVVALYYMMWSNSGSPRLRSIPAGVNVVNLAFLQGDRPSIVGWGAQGQRSFLADARALRARGVRIVASVGGGGGQVNIADRRGFIAGVMALNAKLPLDGLDWDLERTSMGASDVVYISKRLKQLRGSAFSITMAPNGSNIDHYRGVAVQLQRARALNLIGQQFYDAVVSPQAAKGRIDQLVRAGIPPSRISIGMMVGPTSHYWTVDESVTAVRHIKAAYPGVRGGYLWESSRTGTADWVHRVGALLRR
jgi:hypothetical protein